MQRTAKMCVMLAALGSSVSLFENVNLAGDCQGRCGVVPAQAIPGIQGPYGEPITMTGPSRTSSPGAMTAQMMMSQSIPRGMDQGGFAPPGLMPGMLPPGAMPPPGMPGMPGGLRQTGYGPGMPAGAVAAISGAPNCGQQRFTTHRTSVRFVNPSGMKISWYAPGGNGGAGFTSTQLEAPGRYNFIQAAIYRLKLTDIPNRPGVELYPTLEVVPSNLKTDPFLAHSSVPISFTDEDFDQVAAGNFVVKVIYLPDPQFQDLATTGPDEVVSSRLEPGVDPIAEAHRRGSILLVVRVGNIDLEAPNTPAMDAPCAYQPRIAPPAAMGMAPGQTGPGMMTGSNGRILMGPNGPVMMGPNGPVAVYPGMGPSNMLPPTSAPQGTPNSMTPVPTPSGTPSAKLPMASGIEQVQYIPVTGMPASPAALAGQDTGTTPKKSEKSRNWW